MTVSDAGMRGWHCVDNWSGLSISVQTQRWWGVGAGDRTMMQWTVWRSGIAAGAMVMVVFLGDGENKVGEGKKHRPQGDSEKTVKEYVQGLSYERILCVE